MGIQGLLPLLKSIMNPIHIKELEGCFVAVDTYSWLHKGALSCSTDLCKGQPTSKHINYCMHRVNMLRHYGVKPILVFDGGPLPMKTEQEIKRARSRKENLSRAMEHESNGNLTAAYECYQKAVDISPSIAYDLIQVLKHENVPYIVAPYEADAQMTFLAVSKHVEAVITEDSDLIAFGCPRIIYKMDKFGQGVEFKNARLKHNKELNLEGFTQTMLLEMCILSGCDYLQSLPGMGLKKAHALMKKFKNHENVIKHLKYSSVDVPPLYEESFNKAILTFRHQRIYDHVREDIAHLSEPVDIPDEDLDFLGPSLPQPVAKGIAQGDIDPFTKEPIQAKSSVAEKATHGTYQLKFFKPDSERKKIDLPVQKNLLTNYFCSLRTSHVPSSKMMVHFREGFASLEAKRKFRAPRSVPNEENETSSPCISVREEKHGSETDNLKFFGAQDRGPSIKPLASLQNSVCKPCISLHKDLDSSRENGKVTSGNKNIIVRSSYFLKKTTEESAKENEMDPHKNGDDKLENVASFHAYEPLSPLMGQTCKKDEKRGAVRSSYFQPSSDEKDFLKKSNGVCTVLANERDAHKNGDNKLENVASDHASDPLSTLLERTCKKDEKRVAVRSSYFQPSSKQKAETQIDDVLEKYSFRTRFELSDIDEDDDESNTTAKYAKKRVRSTFFKETLANESNDSKDTTISGIADDFHNRNLGGLSTNNTSECTVKRRKAAQTESPRDEQENSWRSGCASDLEEEEKGEDRKFGCNINHLEHYSNIAEKSMEKFVSVISSFRYNSSGSRASGLRAPLKDIKNNYTRRRTTLDMDLRKFAYAPTEQATTSRYHRP